MTYESFKVFDCQNMPEELKINFLKIVNTKSNDVYVDWEINEDEDSSEEIKTIDQWLVENGANPGSSDKCGEKVLIHHWW